MGLKLSKDCMRRMRADQAKRAAERGDQEPGAGPQTDSRRVSGRQRRPNTRYAQRDSPGATTAAGPQRIAEDSQLVCLTPGAGSQTGDEPGPSSHARRDRDAEFISSGFFWTYARDEPDCHKDVVQRVLCKIATGLPEILRPGIMDFLRQECRYSKCLHTNPRTGSKRHKSCLEAKPTKLKKSTWAKVLAIPDAPPFTPPPPPLAINSQTELSTIP